MPAIRSKINVRPMSVHIGAEIEGVDLSQPLSTEIVSDIRQALLKWKVVFFRDQHLDHAQHVRFARHFGALTPGHVVFGHHETYPEIYSVGKFRTATLNTAPPASRPWSGWHTDITAAINPPAASILRGDVVPPYGGDTQWTNLVTAYASLSPTFREMIDQLRGVHRFEVKVSADGESVKEFSARIKERLIVSEHPLVTVHPETGERVLYCSPSYIKSIAGLNPRESQQITELLWEHAVRPEFTVRFRWGKGDIAFWDNRATAHLAPSDIYQTDFDRQFYRVTLLGAVPTGIDGSTSRAIEGEPIEAVSS
jgi:alpha-ketoglutarate-dependent taurine dioxygenase